ncbi:UDP-glucose:(heptosyl)LPS alpha-1,3-glucosyltransferase [Desulfonatronum thiosulfatophilum]|uniref:UDP-glucose:(Heptosyl)LPS alpha-1,3-glucosyltransferase n=1 Tax=Desulfonatronum thiosulfatophilum TaxID=617002 RepID=A0A1G6ATS5_9BACT|nr:glycosyltransferase family 4 protein [Desulfonatronum thiosulfatophilum]SDB11760.1 UDP-glucose:(heptosyl)LPS alpha-1,3-glucosyltransferase [Desulfonatronum thiosulfatophilum]
MASRSKPIAYIVRRQCSGGGAETAARRLVDHLAPAWEVHRLGAGLNFAGHVVAGRKGPGWWRALRFAANVDALLDGKPGVTLNLERGPNCSIYRAGDGMHLRWRALRFGSSAAWMVNPLHWLYPRLEAKTIRSARFVAANSEMVRREMERYHPAAAEKVRVILNGFDPDVFYPEVAAPGRRGGELNLPEQCKLFLFVGSGWRRKGLARALELMAEYNRSLGQDEPLGVLLVVGKGRPEQFKSTLRRLNLELELHVRFLGPQTDLRRFYQAADIFILPTLYDPFSNACLEAMACGCPVMTTANNGAAEVIEHGRTGYILDDDPRDAIHWCRTAAVHPAEVVESVSGWTAARETKAFAALMEECLP